MTPHREIIVGENKYEHFHYPYILKLYWIDSCGLKCPYNEKDIGYLIGHRSDYAINRMKKMFHGHWAFMYNCFFFSTKEEAEQAKDWLEAQILLKKLKDN